MYRILTSAIFLLLAISGSAADRFARDPEEISIATTGRIVKIDLKSRTLRVRASDNQSLTVRNPHQNLSQMMVGLKQRIAVSLPGGITIALPGRTGKVSSKPADENKVNNLEEYTVFVTKDTVFQDGSEYISLEDFRPGETISIHGSINDNILKATRIAKWM
jgi:uncharacterized protein DUF5666